MIKFFFIQRLNLLLDATLAHEVLFFGFPKL